MRRRLTMAVLLLAVACGSGKALAHEHLRVIGTLTKVAKTEIEVQNKDKKVIGMDIDQKTKITRDKKKVPPSELKVGQSVVVDAYGDDETDLLALDIRIVPPIASKKP